MSLSSTNFKNRFFIQEEQLSLLQTAAPTIVKELPCIINQLYIDMQQFTHFGDYFHSEDYIQKVKELQIEHWRAFWEDDLDDAYLNKRERIGQVHARIGLPLDMYYDAVMMLNKAFEEELVKLGLDTAALLSAFHRRVSLDVYIVVDTYNRIMKERLEEQNEALREMSTPVAQIAEHILLLPLVGIIDSKRAQELMGNMLGRIGETGAQVFILDISGIAVVDTAVANHLIKMTKASRLMGCDCIISGISPAVAQTIVELGVQIDEIITEGTMRAALNEAYKLTGLELRQTKK
ncbi:protoglobin domain-containing protein [Saprospira sp. CCB-QB6]|uniref:protoglobin domain-containing protein n=1 Tax=Saprospira sp. CCB-QB6 TaxID=3023936 RepID=UPI00234AD032|nr:protoglobin domain-containing protein [Saprospira sp. CCB-QB6]WCL80750.1 protoglobin domain-containing protein [Saprospira sp. CCB-QB6]